MKSAGGLFPDAGRNLGLILRSPISWAWVVVVVGIHFWVEAEGGAEMLEGVFSEFGLSREGFLSGKVWQLITYGFLHGSWLHVAMNALLVLGMGSRIEHMLGRVAMVRVMVLGLLAGGVAHLFLGVGLLVGLSGACLALLLLSVTLSPQSRIFPLPASGKNIGLGMVLAAVILAFIHPDVGVPGLSYFGKLLREWGMDWYFKVGHACHLGGCLAGWLNGRWVLRPRVTLESLRRDRARREAG